MLGAGSSLTLCQINDFIITQDNTYNPVTYFNYGLERDFPVSLVSASVISTAVTSMALCHSQFY